MTYREEKAGQNTGYNTNRLSMYAEVVLWIAGVPCCVLVLILINGLRSEHIPITADVLVAVSVGIGATLVLAWNMLNVIIARLSISSAVPRRIRMCFLRLICQTGTRRAKKIVIRHFASIGVSSIGLLGLSVPAFAALPSDQYDESTASGTSRLPQDLSLRPIEGNRLGEAQTAHARPSDGVYEAKVSNPPTVRRMHVVVEGECLWTIAKNSLPPEAKNVDISTLSERIYQHNQDAIGSNPDIIKPGQQLNFTIEDQR